MPKTKVIDQNKILEDIYDFAKERLDEYAKEFPTSPKEQWKKTGRLDVLGELLHFLKHYDE